MELCEEIEEDNLEEKELDDLEEEDKLTADLLIEFGDNLSKECALRAKQVSYLSEYVPGIFIPPPDRV